MAELPAPEPPPQPMLTAPSARTSNSTTQKAVFFFALPPTASDPAARAKKGRVNANSGLVWRAGVDEAADVGMLIVKVTLAIPLDGVTV